MRERTAVYSYDDFQEAAPSCWIPRVHQAVLHLPGGATVTETRRITNLAVNEPVADRLFSADTFFPGVTFTDTFAETLGN